MKHIKGIIALFVVFVLSLLFWSLTYILHVFVIVFRSKTLHKLRLELDLEIIYYAKKVSEWSKT